jgi:hypothetical protein
MITINENELREAKEELHNSAGTNQNDWTEGWDDCIAYLEQKGLLVKW